MNSQPARARPSNEWNNTGDFSPFSRVSHEIHRVGESNPIQSSVRARFPRSPSVRPSASPSAASLSFVLSLTHSFERKKGLFRFSSRHFVRVGTVMDFGFSFGFGFGFGVIEIEIEIAPHTYVCTCTLIGVFFGFIANP